MQGKPETIIIKFENIKVSACRGPQNYLPFAIGAPDANLKGLVDLVSTTELPLGPLIRCLFPVVHNQIKGPH